MSYNDLFDMQNINSAAARNKVQWNDLNMNRNTLQAFMKMQQAKDKEDEKSYLEKYMSASLPEPEKITEVAAAKDKADDKTVEAVKDKEQEENYLIKFITASTKKLSAPNKEINSGSVAVSDSVQRLLQAIEESNQAAEPDRNSLYTAADDMVNKFNSFAKAINHSDNTTVAGKAKFVGDMTSAYSTRLRKIGISTNDDGTLTIDKEKFSTADSSDINKALGGKNSFAQFIDEQAKQLATYAQADIFQRAGAYSDSGNITTVTNINGAFMNMLG